MGQSMIDREMKSLLADGCIIATPTDTVWGFLVNGNDSNAVKKLYALKKRDIAKQLILLVSTKNDVEKYALKVPTFAQTLMKKFWPGALTLVFCTQEKVYAEQSTDTIGVRMPNLPELQQLIASCDFPILSTSVNIAGSEPLTSPERIEEVFGSEVKIFIPKVNKRPQGVSSTVISCINTNSWEMLREGSVTKEQLWQALDEN